MSTENGVVYKHYIDSHNRYNRRRFSNQVMLSLAAALTALALIPLFWIVGYVILRGGKAIDLDFFTQMPKPLGMSGGGVLPSIEGTLLLVILAGLFAIPPGVLAAFYVSRHPNTTLGVAVRFGTDVLAGVPSIVIGLFVYALVVKTQGHYSALAGGIALAILMLPTVIRTTEEMLKLVPHNLREASLALGAPEWKTSLSVVLPAAANGVITGFLLGLARATGETAPLLFTALGNERFEIGQMVSGSLANGQDIFTVIGKIFSQPVDSLPLILWKYAQQPFPERIEQSWAAALVLMIMILLLNIIARWWIRPRAIRRIRKVGKPK
jgi:phosphate transport system permease protein